MSGSQMVGDKHIVSFPYGDRKRDDGIGNGYGDWPDGQGQRKISQRAQQNKRQRPSYKLVQVFVLDPYLTFYRESA